MNEYGSISESAVSATPTKRKRRKAWIIVVFVIMASVGGIFYLLRNNVAGAAVGDCVKQTGTNSITKIDCADPGVEWKVIARITGKDPAKSPVERCEAYAAQGAERAYSKKSTRTELVLCLANAKP